MTLDRVSLVLSAFVLVVQCGQASALDGDVACPRDLVVAGSMQRQAIDRLEQAADDAGDTCQVWRRHVDIMRRVASVYARCLAGPERAARLAQVHDSEKEFSEVIRSRCKSP